LKKYFHQKSQQTKLHAAVKGADQGYTPLNLNTELPTEVPKWKQEALAEKNKKVETEKPTWTIPCRAGSRGNQ